MPFASRERAAQPAAGFMDASPAASLPLAPSIPAAIQRAIESNAAAAAEPVEPRTVFSVQREEIAPSGGDPTTASSSAPAAATTAAPAGHSEQEMNELAGKLYDRIRSRLKTELLVDRERAGLLTDLR